jgi:NAD(P)H-hydrate epimerase
MGTGGTGDILAGMIGGFIAQFPHDRETATLAALYVHGLAGEIGANDIGELPLIASDLLRYIPSALEKCARVSDRL